jgi:hypothetical protein
LRFVEPEAQGAKPLVVVREGWGFRGWGFRAGGAIPDLPHPRPPLPLLDPRRGGGEGRGRGRAGRERGQARQLQPETPNPETRLRTSFDHLCPSTRGSGFEHWELLNKTPGARNIVRPLVSVRGEVRSLEQTVSRCLLASPLDGSPARWIAPWAWEAGGFLSTGTRNGNTDSKISPKG